MVLIFAKLELEIQFVEKNIYNIIKHNIYTEMKGGMISFSGKLTTVIGTAINHLRLKHNGKIEGRDLSFLILSA